MQGFFYFIDVYILWQILVFRTTLYWFKRNFYNYFCFFGVAVFIYKYTIIFAVIEFYSFIDILNSYTACLAFFELFSFFKAYSVIFDWDIDSAVLSVNVYCDDSVSRKVFYSVIDGVFYNWLDYYFWNFDGKKTFVFYVEKIGKFVFISLFLYE